MVPPSRKAVAAEIRVALVRKDMTQTELADTVGVSRAAMSERMNGQRAFNTDQLGDIAQVLGVDVRDLLAPPPREAVTA